MSGILTDAERSRFIAWLDGEAACGRGLLEQMEKMGAPPPIIARERAELTAALILLRKLRAIEGVTIEAPT